jgi:hypothetical protein
MLLLGVEQKTHIHKIKLVQALRNRAVGKFVLNDLAIPAVSQVGDFRGHWPFVPTDLEGVI